MKYVKTTVNNTIQLYVRTIALKFKITMYKTLRYVQGNSNGN